MAERLFVCWRWGRNEWVAPNDLETYGSIGTRPYPYCPKAPDYRGRQTLWEHARCGWGTWTPEEAT